MPVHAHSAVPGAGPRPGVRRGLIALGALCFMWSASAAAELPRTSGELMGQIRLAIETRDYDILKRIVLWKDAGKIKKRVVRFHLNRNLGRKIKSVSWETFPEDGMDALIATGKLVPNMEMTHAVRVIFDEEPINASGQLPTSVFLVGKRKGVYRIGLVVRTGFDDDDD
ncbi:MAG: hypothetical protein OXE86_14305 [Alphaproteobacteria bacterium]|nr:hypothetical protein [Alphaproteobacteria bacterium]